MRHEPDEHSDIPASGSPRHDTRCNMDGTQNGRPGPQETESELTLVSHRLCPYVQRAAIALAEKSVPFRRIDIDLGAKPDWFLRLSPTGKTPMLIAGGVPLFESAAILEYLEDVSAPALHPADPLTRARHRGWIDFGSAILDAIAGLYNAPDVAAFAARAAGLRNRFERLEGEITGPWFAGEGFSLVDAVFAPVFRYFDAFERVGIVTTLTGLPRIAAWRALLSGRPSVRRAVGPGYDDELHAFLLARRSYISTLASASPAA